VGWATSISTTTGVIYFVNTTTGQSQYERPVAEGQSNRPGGLTPWLPPSLRQDTVKNEEAGQMEEDVTGVRWDAASMGTYVGADGTELVVGIDGPPQEGRHLIKPRVVLEALAHLNERNGSHPRDIKKAIQEAHPELESSLGQLPIALRKLEKSHEVVRSASGLYSATLAGRATEIAPEMLSKYFVRLFQIQDTQRATSTFSGQITPSDFHSLMKMSGFCFKALQLSQIAAAVSVTLQGTIDYTSFIPTLVGIVRVTKQEGLLTGQLPNTNKEDDSDMAVAEDWDDFEAALGALSIGGDGGEEV